MKNSILQLIRLILIGLYSYVAFSKWFAFGRFVHDMHNQPFARWLADLLIGGLPLLELAVAALLFFSKLVVWGFRLSVVLMGVFTLYVGAVLLGIFDRIPCACGGFLSGLGWGQHLAVNLVLLGVSVAGWYLHKNRKMKEMHASQGVSRKPA